MEDSGVKSGPTSFAVAYTSCSTFDYQAIRRSCGFCELDGSNAFALMPNLELINAQLWRLRILSGCNELSQSLCPKDLAVENRLPGWMCLILQAL